MDCESSNIVIGGALVSNMKETCGTNLGACEHKEPWKIKKPNLAEGLKELKMEDDSLEDDWGKTLTTLCPDYGARHGNTLITPKPFAAVKLYGQKDYQEIGCFPGQTLKLNFPSYPLRAIRFRRYSVDACFAEKAEYLPLTELNNFNPHYMRVWIYWGHDDLERAEEYQNSWSWVKIDEKDELWALREIRFTERDWYPWCDGDPIKTTLYTYEIFMKKLKY